MFRSLRCLESATSGIRCARLRPAALHIPPTNRGWQRTQHVATAAARETYREEEVEYAENEDTDREAEGSHSEDPEIVYPRTKSRTDALPLRLHLRQLFPPLDFSPTVAKQMLTHISAREAWEGHNARLAFIGRRVLESYFLLFLQSVPSSDLPVAFTPDFDQLVYRALHTSLLGEYVGGKWDLAKVMLWRPPINSMSDDARTNLGRSASLVALGKMPGVGLYKVQGTTVEAIMGGIFHQHGGAVAQRVFYTRVLPHMLLPGTPKGVHDAFHPAAEKLLQRMGGPNALLVRAKNEAPTSQSLTSDVLPS